MSWLFVICYFGDEVTIHFDGVGNDVYQCNWYEFPLKMQKCMPMKITLAHKPVYIGSFVQIHCTREIFKRVSI